MNPREGPDNHAGSGGRVGELFSKGLCMGIADVIPGVSGGTMALILGIYEELIDTLRSLHLRWVVPLGSWIGSGGSRARVRLERELSELNLGFLLPLGAGVLLALTIGGFVIPPIMANYPVIVRGFFFGLILSSIVVPLRMIDTPSLRWWPVVLGVGVLAFGAGFVISSPTRSPLHVLEWNRYSSRGEPLGQLLTRAPSAQPPRRVYWNERNRGLRLEIRRRQPERARLLNQLRGSDDPAPGHSGASQPYSELLVPESITVAVPRPPGWYVFLAGGVAICAMILPGISGSYVLLILGCYYFVLQSFRGFLRGLATAEFAAPGGGDLALLAAGAVLGLISFSRLLNRLLRSYHAVTMAGLTGLMAGCLRGVWPFREVTESGVVNVLPHTLSTRGQGGLIALGVGALIVGLFILFRDRIERRASGSRTSS